MHALGTTLKQSFNLWREKKAQRLGAALAYYTIFSLTPLLIIVIALASSIYGRQSVEGQLGDQIRQIVGESGAIAIQGMLENAPRPEASGLATVLGVGAILLGAAGVFSQLKDALSTIWDIPQKKVPLLHKIFEQLIPFGMILASGFILMISLGLSTIISLASHRLEFVIPSQFILLSWANFIISFVIITIVFALMYKFVTHARFSWGTVFTGAIVTSFLFTIGKTVLAIYLSRSGISSAYGAAGSLVVLLVWIYYSAQIFLFGAAFTKVISKA